MDRKAVDAMQTIAVRATDETLKRLRQAANEINWTEEQLREFALYNAGRDFAELIARRNQNLAEFVQHMEEYA